MKRITYFSIAALSLLVMTACKEKNRSMEMPAPRITVATPEVRTITLSQTYPGYLSSEQTVNLVARVNGTLTASNLHPGSRVRQGEVIFTIEPDVYKDAVDQAEAALKTSTAQLVYARSNYSRMQEAAKSGAVSQIQVIQAEATVAETEAGVHNAEAALHTARTNLGYCSIRAPFSGTVTRATADVGNYINGAVQPFTLATLYKDDRMYAYFNIEDKQFVKMKQLLAATDGQKDTPKTITLQLGKEGSQSYTGMLDYLSPNIDLSTGTLSLRAVLDNPDGALKSGLYVTVTLPYGEQPDALLVRDASIGTDQLGKYLYIVNDSNVVTYRHIQIGELINDSLRQVQSGIRANERYVTTALLKVREGMHIQPVK